MNTRPKFVMLKFVIKIQHNKDRFTDNPLFIYRMILVVQQFF